MRCSMSSLASYVRSTVVAVGLSCEKTNNMEDLDHFCPKYGRVLGEAKLQLRFRIDVALLALFIFFSSPSNGVGSLVSGSAEREHYISRMGVVDC